MEEINISAAIEAILFSSGDSVEKSRIAQTLEITEKQVEETVDKDKGTAVVKFDVVYDSDSTKQDDVKLKKVDGKWMVDSGK